MDRETQRRAACCELVKDVALGGGDVRLRVRGCSMLPAIWPGDVVTVRQCAFAELHPGQIALFHRDRKLTAHRIQSVRSGDPRTSSLEDGEIVTRGDSVACFDAPVKAGEIVGRVESIWRGGRSVSPNQTFWQRTASSILRRSELSLLVVLGVRARLRRWGATPVSPWG